MYKTNKQLNRIALITGGNRGLGLELCRQLLRIGFTVLLTSRDLKKGMHAAETLREEGGNIFFFISSDNSLLVVVSIILKSSVVINFKVSVSFSISK